MITYELEKLKNILTNDIEDLIPDNNLINFLTGSSKRIRSVLAILYLKAFGKQIPDDIYCILKAGELIHNASLLHDDVIDNSGFRRGETTIGKKYSPNISILCGDYLVSKAATTLEKLNNKNISINFNLCVEKMAIAEIKQYFMRGKKPSIDDYIEICMGKTSSLFSAILKSAALICDMDVSFADKLGEIFGIYFQIKNDTLTSSIKEDRLNKVYTAVDIIGIENICILSDNYKRELQILLKDFPENRYKMELESIIEKL